MALAKRVSRSMLGTTTGSWVCHATPLGESRMGSSVTVMSVRWNAATLWRRIVSRAGSCSTSVRRSQAMNFWSSSAEIAEQRPERVRRRRPRHLEQRTFEVGGEALAPLVGGPCRIHRSPCVGRAALESTTSSVGTQHGCDRTQLGVTGLTSFRRLPPRAAPRRAARRSQAPSAAPPPCAARRSAPGRRRQRLARELHREGQHVGAVLGVRVEREAIPELRIVDDRLRRVHGCDREVLLLAEPQPLGGGPCLEHVAQDRLQLAVAARMVGELRARPALEQVRPADALAEVLPERLLARHEQHVPIRRFVDLVADALLHAGGAGRAALVIVGLVARDHVGGALVREPALDPIPLHVGGGVGLAELELRALAGLARADHRGEDAERAEHRAHVHADRGVLRDVAEALFVDRPASPSRPRCRRRCRGRAGRDTGPSRRSPRGCRRRSSG